MEDLTWWIARAIDVAIAWYLIDAVLTEGYCGDDDDDTPQPA